MDISPPSVTYDLAQKEYQRAALDIFLHHLFRRSWMILVLIFVTYNVLLLLMFGEKPIYIFGNIAMIGGLTLLFGGLGYLAWRRSGKTFRALPGQFEGITWKLADEALIYEHRESHLRHTWNMFKELYVTKNFIILQRRDVAAYLLPRRAFEDGGVAWAAFMQDKIKLAQVENPI